MKNSLIVFALLLAALSNAQTCSTGCPKTQVLRFVSDTTHTVVGPALPNGGPAVLIDWWHGAWLKNYGVAKWISDEPKIMVTPSADTNRFFSKVIELPCAPSNAVAGITADNAFWTFVNGVAVTTPGCFDASERNFNVIRSCNLNGYFSAGSNLLQFRVRNFPGGNHYTQNPTGLLYTLNITV